MSDNTSIKHNHNESPDVLKLLEDELASCVLPQIKDTTGAAAEDLIKDMHRVLTGNGGYAQGMIYKMAAAKVNTTLLRDNINLLADKVDGQIIRCDKIQESVKAEHMETAATTLSASRIGSILWQNRYMIIVILASVIVVVSNTLQNMGVSTASTSDNQLNSTKEIVRLERLIATVMKIEGIDIDTKEEITNTNRHVYVPVVSTTTKPKR